MATQFEDPSGQAAWALYAQTLESTLGGDQPPIYVQPLTLAQPADWDDPKQGLFRRLDAANKLLAWGPWCGFENSRRLDQEWRDF